MRTVRHAGCLLMLWTALGVLGTGSGCVMPDDIAKQVATNAANSTVRYFFQLLPQNLDELNELTGK